MCCHPNCFNCPYDDCINQEVYEEDFYISKFSNDGMSNKLLYYYTHRKEVLEKRKKYYQENTQKIIDRSKKYYFDNNEQIKEKNRIRIQMIRNERREQGLCVDCGKQKAIEHKSRCQICIDKIKARNKINNQKRKAKNGLCID